MLAAVALLAAHGSLVRNVVPSTADALLDMHDGTIAQWTPGGPYYRYAMAYTDCKMNSGALSWVYTGINFLISTLAPLAASCAGFNCATIMFHRFGEDCGFMTAAQGQTVRVYRSDDLVSWEPLGDAALDASDPLLADAILFRPSVIYSPSTERYVLWLNRIPRGYSVWDGYTRGGFVVAESRDPAGPFTLLPRQPAVAYGGGGDFALLADGARAWIAYGSWDNGYRTDGVHAYFPPELNAGHRIAVQPLGSSFTDVDASVPPRTVTGHDQEAPTLFKHGEHFYLLHGDVCCFCPQGSDSKVQVATDPMSNWTAVTNINPFGRDHVRVQSNAVFAAELADGTTQLVWTADQWGSARSGLKAHDTQFWAPLHFEEREVTLATGETRAVPVPRPVRWIDGFELPLREAVGAAPGGSAAECAAGDGAATTTAA